MQKYKEINGNDYVKDSRTTINETMQSIQSMNSGTSFPTTNLFEGMKCYRTDLKKTYTLTNIDSNTWEEDKHASLADMATKLAKAITVALGGKASGSVSFDGSGNVTINVTKVQADSCTGNSASASSVPWSGVTGKPSTYTPSGHNHDSSYPSVTGARASGTWGINVTGSSKQVSTSVAGTNTVAAVQVNMADSDFFRLLVGGTASNSGYVALDTADDGNEPIYVRQWTDVFQNCVRTAALLDGNGNTSFPGTVSAKAFSGNLSGTASSASSVPWSGVTGKPSAYTPASHSHSWDATTGKPGGIVKVAGWDGSTLSLTTCT